MFHQIVRNRLGNSPRWWRAGGGDERQTRCPPAKVCRQNLPRRDKLWGVQPIPSTCTPGAGHDKSCGLRGNGDGIVQEDQVWIDGRYMRIDLVQRASYFELGRFGSKSGALAFMELLADPSKCSMLKHEPVHAPSHRLGHLQQHRGTMQSVLGGTATLSRSEPVWRDRLVS